MSHEEVELIIASNLNKIQKTASVHAKCKDELVALKEKHHQIFTKIFFKAIQPMLLIAKRESNVERVIQFISTFAYSGKIHPEKFCTEFITTLLDYSNANDKSIRFRVAQIASGIIAALPDDAEIGDDLWEFVTQKMFPRLKDKIPLVRLFAISCLARLQDPTDDKDDILAEFFRLLATDSNKDVRKAALVNLEITKTTLPKIIDRIRDVKEDVRNTAFDILNRVPMKKLAIAQRIKIIQNGLTDRDETVQETCFKIVQAWLQQVDGDILKLLACLDVELYKETCEILIKKLLETEKLISVDFNNLTVESTFYWRTKCDHLKRLENDQALDESLIPIGQFCELLIQFQTQTVNEFIVKELLLLSKHLDYCDEVGRQAMHTLLSQMLIAFTYPELYVKEIIQALLSVASSPDDLSSTIIHAIDELRKAADVNIRDGNEQEMEAIEKELKNLAKQIKSLERKKKNFVAEEEYEEAKKLKGQIDTLVNRETELKEELKLMQNEEFSMWMRALMVIYEFLKISRINLSHMMFLKDDLVLKNLNNENLEVRCAAYSVLSQFCCLKMEVATDCIDKFIKCLSNTAPTALHSSALKGLLDIVLIHGFVSFQVGSVIYRFLESSESELRIIAAEGFAKLLMCKKKSDMDVKICSKLILLLHSPVTEQDTRLRQCLTIFFSTWSFSFLENLALISECLIPVLRSCVAEKVSMSNIAQFIIFHTDTSNLKEKTDDPLSFHESMALSLCCEIMLNPTSKDSQNMAKLFNSFTLKNGPQVQMILAMTPKIKKHITNKVIAKSLEKFESGFTKSKENTPTQDAIDKEIREHEKKHGSSSKLDTTKKTTSLRSKNINESILVENRVRKSKKKVVSDDEESNSSILSLENDISRIVDTIDSDLE